MANLSAAELDQAKAKIEELKASAIRVNDDSELGEAPRKPLSDEDLEKVSGGSYTYVGNQYVWIDDGYDGYWDWNRYGLPLAYYNSLYGYYTYGSVCYAEKDQYGVLWLLIDDGCGGYWVKANEYNGSNSGVIWL